MYQTLQKKKGYACIENLHDGQKEAFPPHYSS